MCSELQCTCMWCYEGVYLYVCVYVVQPATKLWVHEMPVHFLWEVNTPLHLNINNLVINNLVILSTFWFTVAAMKFNENLQELWLAANHLGPEDGQHLGSILRSNHTLRLLDVRENNLQVNRCSYGSSLHLHSVQPCTWHCRYLIALSGYTCVQHLNNWHSYCNVLRKF